ncbi:MAG: hypothetical protein JW940_02675 [Polyangiaceae bacterium]|nr:hypothetical protein [Polyangiaceae bacterium]
METTIPTDPDLESQVIAELVAQKRAAIEAARAQAQADAQHAEQVAAWRAELGALAATFTAEAKAAELEPLIIRELQARRELLAIRAALTQLADERQERAYRAEVLRASIEDREPRSWADVRGRGSDLLQTFEREAHARLTAQTGDPRATLRAFGGR